MSDVYSPSNYTEVVNFFRFIREVVKRGWRFLRSLLVIDTLLCYFLRWYIFLLTCFQQTFRKDLEPLKSRTYEVLNEGRSMIGEGYFDKGEEEHFQDRMDNVDKRMQNLLDQSQRDQEKWVVPLSTEQLSRELSKINLIYLSRYCLKLGSTSMPSGDQSDVIVSRTVFVAFWLFRCALRQLKSMDRCNQLTNRWTECDCVMHGHPL